MEMSSIGISLMSSAVSAAASDESVGGVFVKDSSIPVNACGFVCKSGHTVILNLLLIKAKMELKSNNPKKLEARN